ncbi:MAG: VWA domain-containing protein [Bacteroidota bacterium]|nr:VWA domain-containing protein [Bacteroidota bacterium]
MGNGKFINGKLNFMVTSEYALTATEKTSVKTDLQNASNFMFEATGGQVQFGDVYLVDNSIGKVDAEILLFDTPNALSGGTKGEFGIPNKFARINKGSRNDSSVVVHELAHHIWNLGDEYAGPLTSFLINKLVTSPNRSTIPVLQPTVTANSLAGQLALISFGGNNNNIRKTIVSNSVTEIVVDSDFPDLPTNSSESYGWRQDINIVCSPNNNVCIMHAVGKTLFCDSTNHSNSGTDQEVLHHNSCWETIIGNSAFNNLVVPNSAPAIPPDAVNFLDLEKQGRFALVFDISGSMAGEKLEYTKQGVKYWIDNFSLADDFLSLIAYNSANNILLPLTKVSSIPNGTAQLENNVDALLSGGQTNIRDAIIQGVNQITSIPNRSVSQAVLVLTDGKHNRPTGTSLLEAIPTLDANDVKAMTIGIGEPSDVNFDDLDDLAFTTNGLSYLVGFSNPTDIETALAEANLFLTGNIIDSDFTDFVPSPPQKKYSGKISSLYKTKTNPSLKDVCKILENPLKFKDKTFSLPFDEKLFKVKNVLIEKGCLQANFTINYRTDADVDIFLVNPSNELVEINNNNVRKISDADSHKIILVNKPKSGVWKMVLFLKRLSRVAPKTTVNITVGGKNNELSVWGSATKSYYKKGEPLRLKANASLGSNNLSGLKVYADIRNSDGNKITIELKDGDVLTAESGKYSAEFGGLKKGKYKGVIYIEGQSKSILADSLHLVTHSPAKTKSFNFVINSGKFKRAIPFYFQKS